MRAKIASFSVSADAVLIDEDVLKRLGWTSRTTVDGSILGLRVITRRSHHASNRKRLHERLGIIRRVKG